MKTVACVLSWNEKETVIETVSRLLDENISVVVADNGSADGTVDELKGFDQVTVIAFQENVGSSKARNAAIKKASELNSEYYFLIDGDIVYVPGTIAGYEAAIEKLPNALCLGQNDVKDLKEQGHNGYRLEAMADLVYKDGAISSDFPMAWTQYGLFKASFLNKNPFPEHGSFGLAGTGYEDDWIYQTMLSLGGKSYASTTPKYFHLAHSGAKQLIELGVDVDKNTDERKLLLEEKFGKVKNWREVI